MPGAMAVLTVQSLGLLAGFAWYGTGVWQAKQAPKSWILPLVLNEWLGAGALVCT